MTLLTARPFKHKRNMTAGMIGCGMLRIDSELTQIFSVIGSNDHCRILIDPEFLQLVKNLTGQLIRIGHTTVITVDELFHILKRIDPSHKTRPLRAGIIVEHIHFVGTVRPHMLFMQGKHLRIDPVIRQRLVFKRISERFRRPVRRMRIPEMHMQIPVFFGSVPIQPVQRVRKNFFPRFHSRMPFVISFLKTGLEPPGRMALRESAH